MNPNATEFHSKNRPVMNMDAPTFTPKNKAKHTEQSGENDIHIENTDKEFTPKKLRNQTPPTPESPNASNPSSAPSTPTKPSNEADKQKEEPLLSQYDTTTPTTKVDAENPVVATPSTKVQNSGKQTQLPASDKKQESKEVRASETPAEVPQKQEPHSSKRAKKSTTAKKGQEKQQNQKSAVPSKEESKPTPTPTPTPTPSITPSSTPPTLVSLSPAASLSAVSDSFTADQPKMSYAERMRLTQANKQKEKEIEEQERIMSQPEQEPSSPKRVSKKKAPRKHDEMPQQGGGRERHGGRSSDVSTSPAPRTSTPTQVVKSEMSPPLRTGSPSVATTRHKGGHHEDGEPQLFKPKPVSGTAKSRGAERAVAGTTPPPPSKSAKYPSEQLFGMTPTPAAPTLDTLEPYERRTVINFNTLLKFQKKFTEVPADYDNFLYLLNQLEQAYVAPRSDVSSALSDAELCMRTVTTLLNQMTDKNVANTARRLAQLEIDREYPPNNATLINDFCSLLVAKAASEPKVFTPSYAELVRRLVAFPHLSGSRKDILIILQKKMKNPPAEVKVSAEEETKQLKYFQRDLKDVQEQAALNAVRDYRGCCRFIGHLIKERVFPPPVCNAVLNDCFSLDPLPTTIVLSGMEEFLGVVLDAWVKDTQSGLGPLLDGVFTRIAGVHHQFPKMYYFRFDDLVKKFHRHKQLACATPTPGLDEEVLAAVTPGLPGASDVEEVRRALDTADGLVGLVEASGLDEQRKVLHGALLCAAEADDEERTASDVVAQLKKLLLPETISVDQVIEAFLSVCAEAPYLSVPLAQFAGRAGRCLALAVRTGVVSYAQLAVGVFVPLSKRVLDEEQVPEEQRDATLCHVREYGLVGAFLGPMLAALIATPDDATRTAKELAACTIAFFDVFGEEMRASFVKQCAFIKQHGLERLFLKHMAKERVLVLLSKDTIDETMLKEELAHCCVASDGDKDEDEDNTAWHTACFNALLSHSTKDATPEQVKAFATKYSSVIACLVPKNRLEIAFCFFDAIEHYFAAQDTAEAFFSFFVEMEIVIVPGFQQWAQQRKTAVNDYTAFIEQLAKQFSQQQRKRVDFA